MVRIARFAFDDHREVHRLPLDDFDAPADDCCFEVPHAASAKEQNEARAPPDTPTSIDSAAPSSPPTGHNSLPNKAA